MANDNADVLILGGGVIGLACAYQLLLDGRSVVVLEQNAVGSGSSHGNCGTITPSHAMPLAMPGMVAEGLRWMLKSDAPLYIKPRLDFALLVWLLKFAKRCNWDDFRRITRIKGDLLMRSRERLAQIVENEKLNCEFETRGTLNVFRDPRAMEDMAWLPQALRDIDIAVDVVDGATARRMEPALNDSIVGGFFNPRDAHLRPDRLIAELKRVVLARGGRIEEGARIESVRTDGDSISSVRTARGEFSGRDVVFALGAWSPLMGKVLGLRIPIQPGKGYSITFDRPRLCPRLPVVLKERSVCVTAWSSGYRLGSTMEFSGYDTSLNRKRLDALVRAAGEYLHEPVGAQRVEEWYGWRPMTYDDMPIIGRAPNYPNLVLATGHGMLGVTLAAVTAQLVNEIVARRPPSLDLAPYSLSRFDH